MNGRLIVLGLLIAPLISADPAFGSEPVRKQWTVDGVKREALIFVPETAASKQTPVVFGFHGHGGGMQQASRSFRMHTAWPEAIVVYMQGLPTPGQLTDPEGKRNGWQKTIGDQDDRDLKFFDAVLQTIRTDYKVDDTRIYSMGHSNGGGFTYLLWAARGDQFAAIAPSGALSRHHLDRLKPKPVFHVAGENDPLVRYTWQKAMIEAVRKINRCRDGVPQEGGTTLFPSSVGSPLVTYITSEGHKFPASAPALMVKFFKEHQQPEKAD